MPLVFLARVPGLLIEKNLVSLMQMSVIFSLSRRNEKGIPNLKPSVAGPLREVVLHVFFRRGEIAQHRLEKQVEPLAPDLLSALWAFWLRILCLSNQLPNASQRSSRFVRVTSAQHSSWGFLSLTLLHPILEVFCSLNNSMMLCRSETCSVMTSCVTLREHSLRLPQRCGRVLGAKQE